MRHITIFNQVNRCQTNSKLFYKKIDCSNYNISYKECIFSPIIASIFGFEMKSIASMYYKITCVLMVHYKHFQVKKK